MEEPRRSRPPTGADEKATPEGRKKSLPAADATETDEFSSLLESFARPEPAAIIPLAAPDAADVLEGEITSDEPLAPRPEDSKLGALEDDDALWSQIDLADDDEDEDLAPPSLRRPTPAEEPAAAELPLAEAPVAGPIAVAEAPSVDLDAQAAPVPLHVAAVRGVFAGPNTLSIVSPNLKPDYDELNNVLASFADLGPGQRGFVRMSIRQAPEFKSEARAWVKAVKAGVDPEPKRQHPLRSVFGWGSYFMRYLWFEMNKSSSLVKGAAPLRPGQTSEKKFTASMLDDEKKQEIRDADRKAQDPTHFDVALYIGAVGEQEDKADLERLVEEAAGGYSVYATPHQDLSFVEANPLEALRGFMAGDKRLVLSAAELGELAKVPDGTTTPEGLKVARSTFKHIMPVNPVRFPDPYDPPEGIVPLGVINPNSEDRMFVGMRNEELNQHLFFCGRTGSGKALDVDTPIATPRGWTTMGELKAGDEVFDESGRPCKVVHAFEVQQERPCFEVEFSDGASVVADADHLWLTSTRSARRSQAEADKRAQEGRGGSPWATLLDDIPAKGPPLCVRDLTDLGIPQSSLYAVTATLTPASRRLVAVEQDYGYRRVSKAFLLPEYEREELLAGLRRRAHGYDQSDKRTHPAVVTTQEIADSLCTPTGHHNHAVILARPVEYPVADLPIAPYTLGAWLGDGTSAHATITSADEEVRDNVAADGYLTTDRKPGASGCPSFGIRGIQPALRRLGILRNKHIPDLYLRASVAQRWALLEGLMDTDGSATQQGNCEFYTVQRRLAEQVCELASSLGLSARLRAKEVFLKGRSLGDAYTVTFVAPRLVFRIKRKRDRQSTLQRLRHRFVVDVRPVSSRPVRCIAVDSPSRLFLAGHSFVPTHNSELMKWQVFGVAKSGYPLVVIDPHGQLSDDLLNALVINCPERAEDIVYVDLGDEEWPVAYNPLDIHTREQIEPTVASIKEMLAKELALGRDSAPRAVNYAEQALHALCEANLYLKDPETKCTLLHVVTFFLDAEFRQSVVALCSNQSVKETFDPDTGLFEQLADKARAEQVQPIVRAFQPLGNSPSFSAVFSAGENRLHFTDLITQNKIILVKLARHQHQAPLGEFIGSLILPYLLSSVGEWGRQRDTITRQESGRGCRVFVDEAPTLLGPKSAAIAILAEARKYDLGLIFASQFLDQFDASVIKAALANTSSKLSLVLEPSSARLIAQSIAGSSSSNIVKADDIAVLPNFHWYGNLLWPSEGVQKASSGPFSAACLPPIDSDLTEEHLRVRQDVIDRSRVVICNRRAEIDAKRRNLIDNIKAALSLLHGERLSFDVPPEDLSAGADFGINLSSDPTRIWKS